MPACPKCGNKIASASKTFSILVESGRKDSEGGLTEKKMGVYHCEQCGTKFPVVLDRQHYLVVPTKQIKELQDELKALRKSDEELTERVKNLAREQKDLQELLKTAREEAEVKELESRMEYLEKHVEHLKKDREELEQKISEQQGRTTIRSS